MDHATRSCARYLEHRGYQQAAAITYFSVVSAVAMVVLSVAGYLLADHPGPLARLHYASQQAAPMAVRPLVAVVVDSAIDHRFA